MGYKRRLLLALRSRGVAEAEIADVLREVDSLGLDDAALAAELGEPEAYAASLAPTPRRRRAGGPFLLAGIVAGLAWLAVMLLGQAWDWPVAETMSAARLLPVVGLMVLGVLTQFTVDAVRRPRA